MKKKNSLILDDEFFLYCKLNNIEDTEKVAKEVFNRGFTLLKYGETPLGNKPQEKIIEKEVIVEKVIEVPVEKIVEVIKEIPVKDSHVVVQEIIKEVVVEKNNKEIENLIAENNRLKEEIQKINKSLETLNKAKYLKNSDLNSLYGE